MLKAKTIVVVKENGKDILHKIDSIPYEELADCTGYHEELGFFQSGLDPRLDYPIATKDQVREFEDAFSSMQKENEDIKQEGETL